MIDTNTLTRLSIKYDIDNFSLLREIVQISFLNAFYSEDRAIGTFFKGGTCLRLIYGSSRYSEDLDFTTDLSENEIKSLLSKVIKTLAYEYKDISLKDLKTLHGHSFKIYLKTDVSPQNLTIKLDFSKSENVLDPESDPIVSELPVSTVVVVKHLSIKEIFSEKIRAVMNREKGRDIYDLWYILSKYDVFDKNFIGKNLKYYNQKFKKDELIKKINLWNITDLDSDVRRFLPRRERGVVVHIKRLLLEKIKNIKID